jgi:integrase
MPKLKNRPPKLSKDKDYAIVYCAGERLVMGRWGMVQVQRLALMRPNEVCRMKVGEIDRSGDVWIYRPRKHKGTWRGHDKAVALGKPEQELIAPRLLDKKSDQAVFSPKDSVTEKKERDATNRKTKISPSQIKHAEKNAANSKCRAREHYESRSYAQSVGYAIVRANKTLPPDQRIPHWTPYQLHHSGVTEITLENDGNLDVARAVAGQRSIKVTQGYNHADLKIAIEQAKKRSKKTD